MKTAPSAKLSQLIMGYESHLLAAVFERCLCRTPEEAIGYVQELVDRNPEISEKQAREARWCADAIARSTTIIGTIQQFEDIRSVLA